MPLDVTFVKGKPTGLYVSAAAAVGARATAPAEVTITVATGGATAGDTTIPVEALSTAIKKSTILVFGEVEVVVTADAEAAATSLSVDAVEGETGEGIPGDIAAAATATWDGLYRVLGTSESPYSLQDNTQDLRSVTYDASEAMSWDESEDLSKGWQIQRNGRFKPRDYAFQQIRLAAHEGREIWVHQVAPDENGDPVHTKSGRAKIRGYSETNPAEGIYDASWTFAGQGRPTLADVA